MKFWKILIILLLLFCHYSGYSQSTNLYNTVVKLDSIFFQSYNDCDLAKQAEFYSNKIEFFHDKSGLETSKKKILEDTKKYICEKITRELVKGSIEVTPIPGYGAVELGLHKFYNKEQDSTSDPSRFLIIWRNNNGRWTITKVISLH